MRHRRYLSKEKPLVDSILVKYGVDLENKERSFRSLPGKVRGQCIVQLWKEARKLGIDVSADYASSFLKEYCGAKGKKIVGLQKRVRSKT